MNGAEMVLTTAKKAGIEICFANAGTTELPLVAAFDTVEGIRPVLGLFEGVCTGAADGYGRMSGKPAMNLLHLGPGFANGIANLHNARRAKTPVLNIIGEHASWHVQADPPLAMDIASLAKPVSAWLRTIAAAAETGRDTAEAVHAALYGRISTLIAPCDHLWSDHTGGEISIPRFEFDSPDQGVIDKAAELLKSAAKAVLVLDGTALRKPALEAAAGIKAKTGCDLVMAGFPARMDRGAGIHGLVRMPYYQGQGTKLMGAYDTVIFAGAREPVPFFAKQGGTSSYLNESQRKLKIDADGQDAAAAVFALAEALGASSVAARTELELPEIPTGELTPEKMCAVIAALQPEGCIVVDEGVTSTGSYHRLAVKARPHSYLTLTGGSIGQGMPCALGAALACPDRPVIDIQADGSAMYTLQALWTQAHVGADVVTIICSNRKYFTIEFEALRAGHKNPGESMLSLIDIKTPVIDWVKIGNGMGVQAVSVRTAEDLAKQLKGALAEKGPHLIEAVLP
jgi:acetolactate synthase-1/2/3 large subunit